MTYDRRAFAEALADEYLGPRIEAAGRRLGLRDAVVDLITAEFSGAADELMGEQFRHLKHPHSKRLPDAYLADEATADNALQRAAAGLRTALAMAGRIVAARDFENIIAARMSDDPGLAIRAEMARTPRPLTRPQPLEWSIDPAPWFDETNDADEFWPPSGALALADQRSLPGGTAALAQVDEGPYAGWTQLALVERQVTPARRHPRQPARQVLIMLGSEVTDDDRPSTPLPFTRSPWQIWATPWRELNAAGTPRSATEHLAKGTGPLCALTDGGFTDPDCPRTGLGSPPFLLAPVFTVVAALDLEPTPGLSGFSLSDEAGPGLVARIWRGHLVHDGNYRPLTPAVQGADLLIRPDLLEQLHATVGERLRGGVVVSHRTGREADPGDEE